jgi:poly(glycerol-phosphate) alpha-glucosyltransferase
MLFVSENIYELNSGTEFSQAKHVQLHRGYGIDAKYVTRDYNPLLHRAAATIGLAENESIVNMYDFFQGTMTIPYQPEKMMGLRLIPEIVKRDYHIEGINPNYSLIKYHGQVVGRADVIPATVGVIGDLTWYDSYGNLAVQERYDIRGFKSAVSYYHPNGEIGTTLYLNLAGRPVLEVTHMMVGGAVRPSMFKLIQYQGSDRRFNTEDDLFTFFLVEYLKQGPQDIVVERPTLLTAVANVTNAGRKFAYIHDSYLKTPQKQRSLIQPVYQPLFGELVNYFDGVLVATMAQKEAIQTRFPNITVQVVADTFVAPESKQIVPMAERQPHSILVLGRVAPERRPNEVIKILAEVHKSIPDVQVTFQGYLSGDEKWNKLDQQIKSAGLEGQVHFNEYKTGKAFEMTLDQHQVLLSVAKSEGFGMHLVEAMTHGLPVAAYRTPYEVEETIGQGGVVARDGDYRTLAHQITHLLQNDHQLQELSQAAYENSQRFSREWAWQQWQI